MRARRRTIEVLYPGQTLDGLNGWPGTEVWHADTWTYLGKFNHEGVFVTFLDTLN